MSTLTRTATLESATTDAGIVQLVSSSSYSYSLNPVYPETGFTAGGGKVSNTTKRAWFQFNFNDLGDATYNNDYLAANIIDVTVADFRYTIDINVAGGAPFFVSTTLLPHGVISPPSASTFFINVSSGVIYASMSGTLGAHTIDLTTGATSTVLADIKSAIQNVENNHVSGTSDNGKWAFSSRNGFIQGSPKSRFSRVSKFFLDITYSIDVVAEPAQKAPISPSSIRIIQTSQPTTTLETKLDDIMFKVKGNNIKKTQYQIVESHQTFDNPMINVTSGSKLRLNGNLTELTKNKLGIILLFNKNYRIRIRTHNGSKWSSWVTKNFKTRSKEH